MREYLILRLAGPLQAWGAPSIDRHRPVRPFPGASALAGLLANAGGWTHRQPEQLNALTRALRYAVREDRAGVLVTDYQTAFLGYESLPTTDPRARRPGWTPRGPEGHEGSAAKESHILIKTYLAQARLTVALRFAEDAAPLPRVQDLAGWLRRPARPLFLGRVSCPPSEPLVVGLTTAADAVEALRASPDPLDSQQMTRRLWYSPGEGPARGTASLISDQRDFRTQQHVGTRPWYETLEEHPNFGSDDTSS